MLFSKRPPRNDRNAATSNEETTADWYGWVASAETPSAQVSFLSLERPPQKQAVTLASGESVVGLLPKSAVSARQTASAQVLVTPSIESAFTLRLLLIRNTRLDVGKAEFFKVATKFRHEAQTMLAEGKFGGSYKVLRVELLNVGTTTAEFVVERPIIRIG